MRLRDDGNNSRGGRGRSGDGDDHRLIFPRHALDLARRRAVETVRPSTKGDVVQRIERLLDDMQDKVDQLKDDVDNYKFPTVGGDDDGPPGYAA